MASKLVRPTKPGSNAVDLTVVAVPGYFAAMGLEYWPQRRRHAPGCRPDGRRLREAGHLRQPGHGEPQPARPVRRCPGCSAPITPGPGAVRQGRRRCGRGAAVGHHGGRRAGPPRRSDGTGAPGRRTVGCRRPADGAVDGPEGGLGRRRGRGGHRRRGRHQLRGRRPPRPNGCGERRLVRSLGTGPAAPGRWPSSAGTSSTTGTTGSCTPAATCGRCTRSTTRASATTCRPPCASRWPTPSAPSLPYGLLCLFGIPPEAVATARGVNLIYQFWIHTEVIDRIGRAERALNSPSHHRVHHGTNRQYLDRNHGGILIVWDRMFGTFEPEDERVGLRAHHQHRHVQPGTDRHPRVRGHGPGHRLVDRVGRAAVLRLPGPGLGHAARAAPSDPHRRRDHHLTPDAPLSADPA